MMKIYHEFYKTKEHTWDYRRSNISELLVTAQHTHNALKDLFADTLQKDASMPRRTTIWAFRQGGKVISL
jgi:hypothetical protein